MARYVLVTMTSPKEGCDAEYNDWYSNRHMVDLLNQDGLVSAQRFRFVFVEGRQTPTPKYLALYEVETDDLQKTQANLAKALGTDEMPVSPALDRNSAVSWFFEAITERRIRSAE